MKKYVNGEYIDMTTEEIAAIEDIAAREAAEANQYVDGGRCNRTAHDCILSGVDNRHDLQGR